MKSKMKSLMAITVTLSTVLVVADCWYVGIRKREQPPEIHHPRTCYEKFFECTAGLRQHPFIAGVSTDYRELITNLDQVCEDVQSAVDCIRLNIYFCSDEGTRNTIEAGISVGQYLCGTRGRSLLEEYQNSVCYGDVRTVYQLKRELSERCNIPGPITNCESITEGVQCAKGVVAEECGEAAGEIYEAVANRILQAIDPKECYSEGVGEHIKRGLRWINREE